MLETLSRGTARGLRDWTMLLLGFAGPLVRPDLLNAESISAFVTVSNANSASNRTSRAITAS